MTNKLSLLLAAAILAITSFLPHSANAALTTNVKHVIHIVVDGLRSDFLVGNPAFDYLLQTGACTLNARHDDLSSQTLPNHIGMFTGRPISDHGYEEDKDHNGTIVDEYGQPFQSIFNLIDSTSGLANKRTGFFSSKAKFQLFHRTWPISAYFENKKSKAVMRRYLNEMSNKHFAYSYVHVVDPDLNGHRYGGAASTEYRTGVAQASAHIGEILDLISTDPELRDDTAIILTADHGFSDYGNHADQDNPNVYTIPFCAWSSTSRGGAEPGADLYDINVGNIQNPGMRKARGERVIRNTYSGVLAADWLGIHPNTGAFADQYLSVGGNGASSAASVVSWLDWKAENEDKYDWYVPIDEEDAQASSGDGVPVVVEEEEISKSDVDFVKDEEEEEVRNTPASTEDRTEDIAPEQDKDKDITFDSSDAEPETYPNGEETEATDPSLDTSNENNAEDVELQEQSESEITSSEASGDIDDEDDATLDVSEDTPIVDVQDQQNDITRTNGSEDNNVKEEDVSQNTSDITRTNGSEDNNYREEDVSQNTSEDGEDDINTISAADILDAGDNKAPIQTQGLTGVEIGLIVSTTFAIIAVGIAAYVYITTTKAKKEGTLPTKQKDNRVNLDETRVSISSGSDDSSSQERASPTDILFSGWASSSVDDSSAAPTSVSAGSAFKLSRKKSRSLSITEAADAHIMAVEAGVWPDDVAPLGSIEVTVKRKAKWHIMEL